MKSHMEYNLEVQIKLILFNTKLTQNFEYEDGWEKISFSILRHLSNYIFQL